MLYVDAGPTTSAWNSAPVPSCGANSQFDRLRAGEQQPQREVPVLALLILIRQIKLDVLAEVAPDDAVARH
jgi:hypothetical protein